MNNVVNYTEEETQELVQLYQAGESTAFLADKFSKSERSIIAKLVKQGVYKAKAAKTVKPMLKADIVARIAELLSTDEERVESLEKATGKALTLVLEALEACAHPAFVMDNVGPRGQSHPADYMIQIGGVNRDEFGHTVLKQLKPRNPAGIDAQMTWSKDIRHLHDEGPSYWNASDGDRD